MAKKNSKNKEEMVETEVGKDVEPINEKMTKKNIKKSLFDMSITDLVSYEKAIRMLCVQYEKIINIDETERRFEITPNRERFIKLSSIHKRIMNTIENKALKLEEYED